MKNITKLLATLLVVLLSVCTVCSSVLAETAEPTVVATQEEEYKEPDTNNIDKDSTTTEFYEGKIEDGKDHEIKVDTVENDDVVAFTETAPDAIDAKDKYLSSEVSNGKVSVDVPDITLKDVEVAYGKEVTDVVAKIVEEVKHGTYPYIRFDNKEIDVEDNGDGTWTIETPSLKYSVSKIGGFGTDKNMYKITAISDDDYTLDAYDYILIDIETGEIKFAPKNAEGGLDLVSEEIEVTVDAEAPAVIFDATEDNIANFVKNYKDIYETENDAKEGLTFSNIKYKVLTYDEEGNEVLADAEMYEVNNADGSVTFVAKQEGKFTVLLEGYYTEKEYKTNASDTSYTYDAAGTTYSADGSKKYVVTDTAPNIALNTKKTYDLYTKNTGWATFAKIDITAYAPVIEGNRLNEEEDGLNGWITVNEAEDGNFEIAADEEETHYFEISAYEQETGSPVENITELDNAHKVTITVTLENEVPDGKHPVFTVYRQHDYGTEGAPDVRIEAIDCVATPVAGQPGVYEITFSSALFSTYCVGCSFVNNAVASSPARAIPNTATK